MVKIVVAIMSVPLFYAAMENENVLNLYAKIPKHVSTSKDKTRMASVDQSRPVAPFVVSVAAGIVAKR